MTGAGPLRLEPTPEQTLRDLLFERGVEFPCAGVAQCGGCKVRLLSGDIPVTDEMRVVLTPEEIEAGWRLGCMAEATGPVELEISQWSIAVLDDRAEVPFEPADGLAAVVDLGTTTLVAQFIDRKTGSVVKVETGLNPQARFGADLMSRIRHDLAEPGTMTALIREAVGAMLACLAEGQALEETLLVGNTAMHHFFCGLSVEPLASVPFRSPLLGERRLGASELGWPVELRRPACFLPCVGGFVGSDLLAGLVATGLVEHRRSWRLARSGDQWRDRGRMPRSDPLRLDGGRARLRGRAHRHGHARRRGAIDRVSAVSGALDCSVIGGGPPAGSAAAAWWMSPPRRSSWAGWTPADAWPADGSRSTWPAP